MKILKWQKWASLEWVNSRLQLNVPVEQWFDYCAVVSLHSHALSAKTSALLRQNEKPKAGVVLKVHCWFKPKLHTANGSLISNCSHMTSCAFSNHVYTLQRTCAIWTQQQHTSQCPFVNLNNSYEVKMRWLIHLKLNAGESSKEDYFYAKYCQFSRI